MPQRYYPSKTSAVIQMVLAGIIGLSVLSTGAGSLVDENGLSGWGLFLCLFGLLPGWFAFQAFQVIRHRDSWGFTLHPDRFEWHGPGQPRSWARDEISAFFYSVQSTVRHPHHNRSSKPSSRLELYPHQGPPFSLIPGALRYDNMEQVGAQLEAWRRGGDGSAPPPVSTSEPSVFALPPTQPQSWGDPRPGSGESWEDPR